ncbi:MAG: hypothetical protein F6K28_17930 [Microcoleus sp. SIO2G3]|nr:hypothetical protein [Microcoleus sp. SIO2G3]
MGRKAFYSETFGNEVFQTDVVGALDGPINPVTMTKAIARLGGKHTTNLQIPLDEDVTIGERSFKKGILLNTGLDVPARSLLPLGMRLSIGQGKYGWVSPAPYAMPVSITQLGASWRGHQTLISI